MRQSKGRAFGLALFFFLTACAEPPLSKTQRYVLRRYAESDCIPSDAVVRNIHIETLQAGTVKISDAFTGRHVFVHATPTEMRIAPGGLTLFIRDQATLYEYRLNPVQFQTRIDVQIEQLPSACH